MKIGHLDRRLTIEQRIESDGPAGTTETIGWGTLATVWAARMDKAANERFGADRVIAERATVWRIRYRSDVTEDMRVTDGTTTWEIRGMTQVGRRVGLDLQCDALDPAGA